MNNPPKILIIEDNPASIEFIKRHLEKEGFETISEKSGLRGVNAARTAGPDLILLDIMLPDMDGHKVCRMIKMNKSLQHIPIAMFTSRDTDEDADKAKAGGADAFILKNTRVEIVLSVIRSLLAQKEEKPSS